MRLIHIEVAIEFVEEFASCSISQKLHKALTGKTPTEKEPIEPGVEFRSKRKRQVVTWDINSCRVVTESISNYDESIIQMAALIETINKIAPIGKLSKKEFITHWILPAEQYSFKLLEQKYRENFIAQKSVWHNVFDSSVILDMKIKDSILHHQSGAMKTGQLRNEFSEFSLQNIPGVFLFLWAAIENNKIVEYSGDDMKLFLTESLFNCKRHSELFEEIWGGIL
ncbi:MAG: hypothetical protein JXA46_09290 [Dehalococcoidales bacterium]|nr:hypothetical protein [Dehalococcoidales bacterium]